MQRIVFQTLQHMFSVITLVKLIRKLPIHMQVNQSSCMLW